MNWILTCLAGTLSGLLGAMGLGGGGVLIIYLTLFTTIEQTTAQGINLMFFIPSALIAVLIYAKKKLICWNAAIPAILLGLIGAWLGTTLSSMIDGAILGKIFGGLLFIMGLMQLFSKNKKKST